MLEAENNELRPSFTLLHHFQNTFASLGVMNCSYICS